MARTRNLKPGFFKNETLTELPYETRLLFAGLWIIADRSGRLEDRPKRIHAELFPYDWKIDVDKMLEQLDEHGFILRYQMNGASYIQIPKWYEHQNPHHKEIESVIPPIPLDLVDFKACLVWARQSREKAGHDPEKAGSDRALTLNPLTLTLNHGASVDAPGAPAPIDQDREMVRPYAARIHERHPAVRRCGPKEVEDALLKIVRKLPKAQRVPKLEAIDRNHECWCKSEQWCKDGGEYAKGLDNWLAPTMGRYDTPPPQDRTAEVRPQYTKYIPPAGAK